MIRSVFWFCLVVVLLPLPHGGFSFGLSQREFHDRSKCPFDMTATESPLVGLQQQRPEYISQGQ